jgi:serine/threonine protein phosphatase PrpC
MKQRSDIKFDSVSALIQGARDYQEDALVADFPMGSETGIIVLSDGMGGHAAGDVASKIVMTEVYSELKFQSGDAEGFEQFLPEILLSAAQSANECIGAHVAQTPDAAGMGATLLGVVIVGNRLYWISIGDSPLYLYRDGEVHQINEDHSMAPQIDLMVVSGMMEPEAARNHPDRNALTSVLSGEEISKVDCPMEGIELSEGDIVIAASDGLQFLDESTLVDIVLEQCDGQAMDVAQAFLDGIEDLSDPEQDNTSFAVVKIGGLAAEPDQIRVVENEDEDEAVRPRRVRNEVEQLRERPVRVEART